jgi:hypothetical protein
MTITRHIYAIAGFVTLLSAAGLSTTHVAAARTQPMPVNVINSAANPVPTVAQGTTNIAGTVAVSSLPAVQLTASNVGITNGLTNPVPVHVVDSTVTTQLVKTGSVDIQNGFLLGSIDLYTVPAGKQVVVTDVFVNATVPDGQFVALASINSNGVQPFGFTMSCPFLGSVSGSSFYNGNMNGCHIVFPAGTHIGFTFERSDLPGTATFFGGFSAYEEDQS